MQQSQHYARGRQPHQQSFVAYIKRACPCLATCRANHLRAQTERVRICRFAHSVHGQVDVGLIPTAASQPSTLNPKPKKQMYGRMTLSTQSEDPLQQLEKPKPEAQCSLLRANNGFKNTPTQERDPCHPKHPNLQS